MPGGSDITRVTPRTPVCVVALVCVGVLACALPGCGSDVRDDRAAPLAQDDPAADGPRRGGNTITLVADAWPPFNCAVGDSDEGYMVDVARAVFEPLGYEIVYLNVPWLRALSGTRSGQYDGAIAPSRIEGPDFLFPDLELSRNRVSFFVRDDSAWRFTGPASLAGVSLGVVNGYDYVGWLNQYIRDNEDSPELVQVLAGDYPLRQNIRKLVNGRIDVLAGNEDCIRYVARQLGLLDRIRRAGFDSEESYCYIAFSPATGTGTLYADILSQGIRELRRSGRLAAILDRYGLEDWDPAEAGNRTEP